MEKIIQKISKEIQDTPAYIFSIDEMKKRVNDIKRYLPSRIKLCYALKANPFLTSYMDKELEILEVCSPGEFAICEKLNVPMDHIVMSGVYKNRRDIEHAINKYPEKGLYTVESPRHLEIINDSVNKGKINVILRLSAGNQFGMDERTIDSIIENKEKFANVNILGIQYYGGTQKKKSKVWEKDINRLDELISRLNTEYGFETKLLEYGPGLPVSYFLNDDRYSLDDTIGVLRKYLLGMKYQGDITLEMGRYLASSCGYYVTSIVDKKNTDDVNYSIIDGGINHINYYGQMMGMKKPSIVQISTDGQIFELSEINGNVDNTMDMKVDNNEEIKTTQIAESDFEKTCICGALCTTSDVILKEINIRKDNIGSRLIFRNIGAYSVTEGIYLFLSRDLPKIYIYDEKNGFMLVRDTINSWKFNT